MRIETEIDDQLSEPEIHIRAASTDPRLARIQQLLTATFTQTLPCYQDNKEYFIPLADILFVETDARVLQVHTADDTYSRKDSLHETGAILPPFFLQISKSTIVNLNQVGAVTRAITNCLVEFHGSYKQVYASRRYYKQLLTALKEMRS